MPSTDHLQQHQFKVVGDEPLGEKPFVVRLYQSDDDLLKAMPRGEGARFIRQAVREKLQGDQ